MAYDPSLNSGGACKNPMNTETNSTDFDWYQNEESFDLSSFMSNSANLELCNDDLFQNLFPSSSPDGEDLKKDNPDQFYDDEVENWYHNAASEPPSACASACSSAVPSPVQQNFYNTPPVTPQSERQKAISPHHLQFEGLTTTMSSSRFASLRRDEGSSHFASVRPLPPETRNSSDKSTIPVEQEPDSDNQLLSYSAQTAVKSEQSDSGSLPIIVDLSSARQLKQPLKRPSVTASDTTPKKSKMLVKGTVEYIQKRQRNNVAVRRSRDKAKQKSVETQRKVEELSDENETLRARVAELTHELNTLKNLLKSFPHVAT